MKTCGVRHAVYCQLAQADLDVLGTADLLGFFSKLLNQESACLVNSLFDRHRVGASADCLQTKVDHLPGKHRCCCGAVTSCIVCAAGHLLDQLCPGILHCIFELNCSGNGDTIIDYLRVIVALSMPVQMPYQTLQVLEGRLAVPHEHVQLPEVPHKVAPAQHCALQQKSGLVFCYLLCLGLVCHVTADRQ